MTSPRVLIPKHLSQASAAGIARGEVIAQFELGSYKNFVYLVIDWKSQVAALVDPQSDLLTITNALTQFELKLESILLTHTHHDHIAGLPALVTDHPELPVYVGAADLHRIPLQLQKKAKIKLVSDEVTIPVGALRLNTLHTPGHSAGEICYFLQGEPPFLLTGDTVFIRDCGRTDFPDGSNEEMFRSLQKIKALPSNTIILPGHHYQKECASVLELECQESLPLRCKTVEELANLP